MDIALSETRTAVYDSAALGIAQNVLAFLMLGGASLILLVFCLSLSVPAVIMQDGVRALIQWAAGAVFAFILLFSYPHFIWSYRLAYQQGTPFIARHWRSLIAAPLILAGIVAVSLLAWNLPVTEWPLIAAVDNSLRAVGIDLSWSSYAGVGQMLLATLLIGQTVLSGHHYCMQAYGVALASGEEKGFRLNPTEKKILRLNMYSLWAMNILSGYTFFAMLNNGSFVYHPPRFPQPLFQLACLVFAISLVSVAVKVLLPVYKQNRKLPPLLAAVPIVSVWIWLQPFCQPFGYQAWIVPLAHGAQYMFFAGRVEGNNFGAGMPAFTSHWPGRILRFAILFAVIFWLGYLCFIYLPILMDGMRLFPKIAPNFFVIAIFNLLSIHHYFVDGVVWRQDSRARKLMHSIAT